MTSRRERGAALAIDGGSPAVVSKLEVDRWPQLRPETIVAVTKYLESGSPLSIADGGGVVVGQLERALGTWLERPPVLTTNSGTTALFSAFATTSPTFRSQANSS